MKHLQAKKHKAHVSSNSTPDEMSDAIKLNNFAHYTL